MNKIIVLVTFLVVSCQVAFAQKDGVKLLASPRENTILLRWAPTNTYTWQLANQYGYLLKRYTIVRGKKVVKEVEVVDLTASPLKPEPLINWEPYADDKYVSVAAQCIFNSNEDAETVYSNPHQAYKKYKELQQRFGFALYCADQSVRVARLSGLYFEDKTALPKEKYLYKVFINCPDSLAVDSASSFTGLNEYIPLPKPLDFHVEWGDKLANLSWNILYQQHFYSAYFVEKSTDGGKNYVRTSENNAVQLSDKDVIPKFQYKTDTLLNNTDVLYYRVRGVTAFGEISPPSDSVFGKGRLPLKGAPVFINEVLINNEYIQLDWIYPSEMNEYITGFKIFRSSKPNVNKNIVHVGLDPAARSFTDSFPNITNYYFISAYNNYEEKITPFHTYVQRIDSFPPHIPLEFNGEIDTLGAVHLSWKPNSDEDISGYRVYRANNPKFEFSLVHPSIIKDTQFVDSINIRVLNKNIYYRLRAIDVRDNQSAFSSILTLKRPDVIAPVPPVLKDLSINKKGEVVLEWVNSSSTDVLKHYIYRKIENDSIDIELVTLGRGDSVRATYIDETVDEGVKYIYYLRAQDDSELFSNPSNNGYIKTPGGKEDYMKLKRRVFTDRVRLTWNLDMIKKVKKVIVYRSVNDGSMQLYGYSTTDEYVDNRLAPEKKYTYAIKIEFLDGSTSLLSNSVVAKM